VTTATEIKAFLDAIGSLGSIRVGSLPASPDIMGCVYEYPGQASERRLGVAGVGYEKPSIQVVFRGIADDYAGPRAKAETAYRALAAAQPGVIVSGSAVYLQIDPQQPPHPVGLNGGKDENRRFEIGCNFYVTKEPS
jgi:hypothetical protein